MKEAPQEYSDNKTVERRDAALLRALSTPHKRQEEMKIGRPPVARDPTEFALRRALDREASKAPR
jgi:magnesium-transporting ATPase (P-type)